MTNETPLSEKIQKRRLQLFGHILRLHPDTPAQKALDYFVTPGKRPVGHPKDTWLALITKDLTKTIKQYKIKTPFNKSSLETLKNLAGDRIIWRREMAKCTRKTP